MCVCVSVSLSISLSLPLTFLKCCLLFFLFEFTSSANVDYIMIRAPSTLPVERSRDLLKISPHIEQCSNLRLSDFKSDALKGA